jgi:putative transposase
MSRFRKLSHTIWHCQYHIVWVPKYRFRILTGRVSEEVERCIRAFAEQQKCEVVELNVQIDHVHLLVMIPPKIAVSDFVGTVKGRTAIRVFNQFRELKKRPYWGNHFWARGYCTDTVGLDAEKIRTYVRYQEKKERRAEQLGLEF